MAPRVSPLFHVKAVSQLPPSRRRMCLSLRPAKDSQRDTQQKEGGERVLIKTRIGLINPEMK